MAPAQPHGGVQIRWSHYWPQHLGLELTGSTNLELFVINYLFARPGTQPWDYWLQCLGQESPREAAAEHVLSGRAPAGRRARARTATSCAPATPPKCTGSRAPPRRSGTLPPLTVTNSHDLERYGTKPLLEAYWRAFSSRDDVVLVMKDYGASSGDTTLRRAARRARRGRARVEYVTEFTSKEALIALYKSCDAFVSAHRGEGYGMKILDALACGAAGDHAALRRADRLLHAGNCLPVDFSLVPVGDCLDTRVAAHHSTARCGRSRDVDSLAAPDARRSPAIATPPGARRSRRSADVARALHMAARPPRAVRASTWRRWPVASDRRRRRRRAPAAHRPSDRRTGWACASASSSRPTTGSDMLLKCLARARSAVDPAAGVRSHRGRRRLDRWHRRDGSQAAAFRFALHYHPSGEPGTWRGPQRRACSRRPASWCCSSATTSSPTSACSRRTCCAHAARREPAPRCSATSTGRRRCGRRQ